MAELFEYAVSEGGILFRSTADSKDPDMELDDRQFNPETGKWEKPDVLLGVMMDARLISPVEAERLMERLMSRSRALKSKP